MIEETPSLTLHPTSSDIGKRLDAFLSEKVDGWSRSRLRRLIDDGDVLINGLPSKASYKVRENDEIELELTEPPVAGFEPVQLFSLAMYSRPAFAGTTTLGPTRTTTETFFIFKECSPSQHSAPFPYAATA